jgi:manganese/zinc/iron transport system permease protein
MFETSVVWKVMAGSSLLGAAAALVGSFALLRRRALLGDMLSHAALPGIAIAFLVVGSRDLLPLSIGALGAGLVAVGAVAAIHAWTRTSPDAAIGIVLSSFFGAGVVLLTVIQSDPTGNQAGLNSYLFGEIASLQSRDLWIISGVAALMLVLVTLFYKELKVLSFDYEFATSEGWPTFWLDFSIMAAIAVVTVIGLPVCGVVLMAAMLITPAAAARFWSNRLGSMLVVAVVLGAAAGGIGCLLAAPKLTASLGLGWLPIVSSRGSPPGPMIVLAGAMLLILSMLFAPERGLLARWWSELKLRRRIGRDHLLRGLYELSETAEGQRPWVSRQRLLGFLGRRSWVTRYWLWRSRHAGNIEIQLQDVRFTPQGLNTAVQLVRAHRLWELYLLEDSQRGTDRVHDRADEIEHLLPAEVVSRLETMLETEGKWSSVKGEVPPSPHSIEPG